MVEAGAVGVKSLDDLMATLTRPRTVWLMLPAAIVDKTIAELIDHLAPDDVLIDGGNSHYRHDIDRAKSLKLKGIHYLDVGTSGGVWGLERGYCLMIGGEAAIVKRLDPIFAALAPPMMSAVRTAGREKSPTTAEHGYLHCGSNGAGHFVKMVHNGIEYGIMAAYAEGFNILRHANAGAESKAADAEIAEAIAAQTGATAKHSLYGDTLGSAGSDGDTYLRMEAANADAMVRGFTGGGRGCRPEPLIEASGLG